METAEKHANHTRSLFLTAPAVQNRNLPFASIFLRAHAQIKYKKRYKKDNYRTTIDKYRILSRRLTVHMHQPDGRTEFDFFEDVFGEKSDPEGNLSLGWRWIDLSSPTYAGVAC